MNISQATMNFTGKLMNQTYIGRDSQTKEPVLKEYSYEQMVDSYDKQIAKIQNQKAKAVELDTFMRTDKEAQELIAKLPNADVIEIGNHFSARSEGECSDLEIQDLVLLHSDTDENGDEIDLAQINAQDANGEIDKKGIIEWLKELVAKS